MDLKRHSYQCTVQWTMQGLTETFLNIVGCCNFTEAKIGEVCTGQGTISQKLNNTCKKTKKTKQKKTLHLALSTLKKMSIWSIVHRFQFLGWSVFGSKFTKFDRICILVCTRQPHSPCCKECVKCLSFYVPCFEAVV